MLIDSKGYRDHNDETNVKGIRQTLMTSFKQNWWTAYLLGGEIPALHVLMQNDLNVADGHLAITFAIR